MTVEVVSLINPDDLDRCAGSEPLRLSCKFVVVKHDEILHLVIGCISEYPYHANLLDRFCAIRGIASSWIKKPDYVEIYDDSVEIRGGGHIVLDMEKETALFSGYSTAYGCYEPSDIRLVTDCHDFFSGYQVEIPE